MLFKTFLINWNTQEALNDWTSFCGLRVEINQGQNEPHPSSALERSEMKCKKRVEIIFYWSTF